MANPAINTSGQNTDPDTAPPTERSEYSGVEYDIKLDEHGEEIPEESGIRKRIEVVLAPDEKAANNNAEEEVDQEVKTERTPNNKQGAETEASDQPPETMRSDSIPASDSEAKPLVSVEGSNEPAEPKLSTGTPEKPEKKKGFFARLLGR